jgi:O-antigen ligase
MILSLPTLKIPRIWWILGGLFALTSLGSLLPASWFGIPEWRTELNDAGVPTGTMVAIQARQSAEFLVCFWMMLFVGLWLAGHRVSRRHTRFIAVAFCVGVAFQALVALALRDPEAVRRGTEHFGFFVNRNHHATLLAMGALCGLGCVIQAVREKQIGLLVVTGLGTAVCVIAVFSWSVSRSGIMLVGVGSVIWLATLGPRYLGRHAVKVLILAGLLAGGLVMLSESRAMQRLETTVERTDGEMENIDFRVPTWLDTLEMIKEAPWTGVGAGQFAFIFPQYRDRTSVALNRESVHPESDWLWMASEVGIPGSLALLGLVIALAVHSYRRLRIGRGRAIRSACLVAAFLVPLHGFFDVPGHRVALAWAASLLFVLSLPASDELEPKLLGRRVRALYRIAGVGILGAGVWLASAVWFGAGNPRLLVADVACDETMDQYREDQRLKALAQTEGRIYEPPAEEFDPLDKAYQGLKQATAVAPLDQRLYLLGGSLGLFFEGQEQEVDKAFLILKKLNPTSVDLILKQASAWKGVDQTRSKILWNEALDLASNLEDRHPQLKGYRRQVLARIKREAKGIPVVEEAVKSLE